MLGLRSQRYFCHLLSAFHLMNKTLLNLTHCFCCFVQQNKSWQMCWKITTLHKMQPWNRTRYFRYSEIWSHLIHWRRFVLNGNKRRQRSTLLPLGLIIFTLPLVNSRISGAGQSVIKSRDRTKILQQWCQEEDQMGSGLIVGFQGCTAAASLTSREGFAWCTVKKTWSC